MITSTPAPQSEPNDALLERYLLGELDAERSERLRRLAASDAGLRARLADIGASDAAILERYPAEAMSLAIRSRSAARAARNASDTPAPDAPAPAVARHSPVRIPADRIGARSRPSRLAAALAPARLRLAAPVFALLICGVFLLARPGRQNHDGAAGAPDGAGNPSVSQADPESDVRLKGAESGLAIFRKTGSGSELLPPRSAARAGDTLQVFYHSRRAVYGIVFSVDGAGSVTLHYPEAAGPSPALRIGEMLPLPHAFRLDKAPRFERFYLVTAPRPFASEDLISRLRGSLPADASPADTLPGLEADFRQYPYTLFKAEAGPRKSRKGAGR
jgi:hypothetical protein